MANLQELAEFIQENYVNWIDNTGIALNQLTVEVKHRHLINLAEQLRSEPLLQFDVLVDLCGVDYAHYGKAEWDTESVTTTGFSRGVVESENKITFPSVSHNRFAVVYHLLSTTLNQRIRLKVFCPEETLLLDSVISIWNSANWYEREAFDLYGILFNGHPDLRRILTDYGFIGHPFRKDFPMLGHVEMRYDAKLGRIIYEPVDITSRVLVPKVIRADNRYGEEKLPHD